MENNKRIVLSIAMVAIIAVAAIGVGYAYTAMTTNSGNNASTEYVTLVQGGDGAYTFSDAKSVYWNSADGKQETKYVTTFTLTNATATLPSAGTIDGESYKAVQIGDAFTIKASQTGGTLAPINGIITASGFNKQIDGLEIFMSITPTGDSETYYKLIDNNTFIKWDSTQWTDNLFTIPYDSSFKDLTVKLYYAAPEAGIAVEHTKGYSPAGPAQNVIASGTLTFKAFTSSANGSVQTVDAITGTDTINVGGTTALTATASTGSIIWSSTNDAVATTSGSTVTGVSGGKALIVATGDASGYSVAKLITVNPKVTFEGNESTGGSTAAQDVTYGSATALTANGFERSGYTFAGWNTKADGSGTQYTNAQSVTLTSNLTLYAQWVVTPSP